MFGSDSRLNWNDSGPVKNLLHDSLLGHDSGSKSRLIGINEIASISLSIQNPEIDCARTDLRKSIFPDRNYENSQVKQERSHGGEGLVEPNGRIGAQLAVGMMKVTTKGSF